MRPEQVQAAAEVDRILAAQWKPKPPSNRLTRALETLRGTALPAATETPATPAKPEGFLNDVLRQVPDVVNEPDEFADADTYSPADAEIEATRLAGKYTPKDPPKVQRAHRIGHSPNSIGGPWL